MEKIIIIIKALFKTERPISEIREEDAGINRWSVSINYKILTLHLWSVLSKSVKNCLLLIFVLTLQCSVHTVTSSDQYSPEWPSCSISNRSKFHKEYIPLCRALKPPGWKIQWHCGVRVASNKKLVGFISAIPAHIRVYDQWVWDWKMCYFF